MNLNRINVICFSPTRNSKRVAVAIARGVGVDNVEVIDLTSGVVEEKAIPESELAIIAVPVYGGRVAPLAMERLKTVRGSNTPAILIVTYGNRAYEKSLAELDGYAVKHGFKVIAAGTFIAEHSFSSAEYPISGGRPDEADLEHAVTFGKQVREKVDKAAGIDGLYPVDVNRIRRPKQPFFPLFRFLRKVIKMRKSGMSMQKTPLTDKETCIQCGVCVERCPNGAITKGEELYTDAERCIRCCACVKYCSQQARSYDTPYAPLLSDCFSKQKQPQVML